MTRISSVICYVVALSMIVQLGFAQRRPKDKILDRKVFVVQLEEVSEKAKKKVEPVESELSFRSNKLVARYMQSPDAGGFQAGDYLIYEKEDLLGEKRYKFEGINKNSKGLSLKWKGAVFGGQIKGTATVSKKGKVKKEYRFAGALKQKRKR